MGYQNGILSLLWATRLKKDNLFTSMCTGEDVYPHKEKVLKYTNTFTCVILH